ncbi:kinase-like domain-containing protein [Haematococcus lacustris]
MAQKGGAPVDASSLAVPSMPGRLSEAYDVQKAVGKGGYAVVYKAIRRQDNRIVAVKKVEIFEMTQKKRDRCLQEVTLLEKLSHPNIIQMLDAFIDENMLIIIFEWAPAGDLKRLIKKTQEAGKTLDEPAIWGYFAQIVDGLRYMHQHRIMHRDIKPANVLVGANGALKLGDLGLGRQLSEQTMEAFSKVGTPYFVSPEVVRGAGYDWKSDVWSLGCLLYELAALRSPFEMEGANLYDVFQKISKADFQPLPAEHFSANLRQLLSRMLQVDPSQRPELEEVWALTHQVLAARSHTTLNLHLASESVYAQLMVLEAACTAALPPRGPPAAPSPAPSLSPSPHPPHPTTNGCGSTASSRASTPGGGPSPPPNPATASRSRASKHAEGRDERPGSGRQAGAAGREGEKGGPACGLLPTPPSDTLRLLHPVFFAESLARMPAPLLGTAGGPGHRGGPGLRVGPEEAQRQQLGAFLHVFAWLLKVGGHSELTPPLEATLEMRPLPGRRSMLPPPPSPPNTYGASPHPHANGISNGSARTSSAPIPLENGHATSPAYSSSSRRGRSRIMNGAGAGAGAAEGAAPAVGVDGSMRSPCPPPMQACMPVCMHVLKGAEAAKRAAQAAGLSTEFAPLTALAAGYGRATCSLLQDALDAVHKVVPLQPGKPPKRPPEGDSAEPEDGGWQGEGQGEGQGQGEGADLLWETTAVMTCTSPLPLAYTKARAGEMEEEEVGLLLSYLLPVASHGWRGDASRDGATCPGSAYGEPAGCPASTADTKRMNSTASSDAAVWTKRGLATLNSSRTPAYAQVDPVAWQAELERLHPVLSRIKISASAMTGPDTLGAWTSRWDISKCSLQRLVMDAPNVITPLTRLSEQVAGDMGAIQCTERRLNNDSDIADKVRRYAASRQRLAQMQREIQSHEELQQAGHAALAALSAQMAAVQEQLAEKAAGLDGTLPIQQMHQAMQALRQEMVQMDLRTGVLQQQLVQKEVDMMQRRRQQQPDLPLGLDS